MIGIGTMLRLFSMNFRVASKIARQAAYHSMSGVRTVEKWCPLSDADADDPNGK
jgi:hypothetical protein